MLNFKEAANIIVKTERNLKSVNSMLALMSNCLRNELIFPEFVLV